MRVLDTEIADVKIIEPTVYEDERGYFFEALNAQKFRELMGFRPDFSQLNESGSKRGTIRGLHLQKAPHAQSKLVRVVDGEAMDVVLDCRADSPTFGTHICFELSSSNKRQVWIPRGCAHGFQALSEFALVNYMVDNPYRPEAEVTINCFDEALNIPWRNIDRVVVNKKDKSGLSFAKYASSVF